MIQKHKRTLLLALLSIAAPILAMSQCSERDNQSSFLLNKNRSVESSQAPQYQAIPILQDESGLFYINITWKNSSSTPILGTFEDSDSDSPNTDGKMVLALYTNTSFVSTCENFLDYDCSSLDCQINDLVLTVYSYLLDGSEIQGYSIDIGLLSPAFNMCGYSVIYAVSCAQGFPPGLSGFLGLGFALNAFFQVNSNFSIFLSNGADGLDSQLFVGSDNNQDLIDSTGNFMQTWDTDKNWMVDVIEFTTQEDSKSGEGIGMNFVNSTKALFDINIDAIGLPRDTFNYSMGVLESHGVECNGSPYQPSCTYDGDVNSLPVFYLQLEGEGQPAIGINPQIYFSQNPGQKTSYTLMFAELATDIPGAIQVSSDYEGSIILGRPFMTFYYVHFSLCSDYIQPFITIYHAQHNSTTTPSSLKTILIICGASVALVLIIIAVVCIVVKRRRKNQLKKKIKEMEEEINTVTTPTRLNRKKAKDTTTSNIRQPLLNQSVDSTVDPKPKAKKEKDKIWSNDNIGFVDPDEINAYTYKKQEYRGLYESESDSLSLNDDTARS